MGDSRWEADELVRIVVDVILRECGGRGFLGIADYLALGEALGIQARVGEAVRGGRSFLLKLSARLGYSGWLRWLAATYGVTANDAVGVHPPLAKNLGFGSSVAAGFVLLERGVFRGDFGLVCWALKDFRPALADADKLRLFEDACFWCGEGNARFAIVRMLFSEFGLDSAPLKMLGFWAEDLDTRSLISLRPHSGSSAAASLGLLECGKEEEEAVLDGRALAVAFRRGPARLREWLSHAFGITPHIGALPVYRRACARVGDGPLSFEEGAEYQLLWERCPNGEARKLEAEEEPPSGAEPEENGEISRLLRACRGGRTGDMEELAGNGELTAVERRDIFQVACATGRLEVVKWSAEYLNITAEDCAADDSIAFWAACAGGHLGVARWLADNYELGCEAAAARGCSAMSFASAGGHWELVEWLAERFGLTARNAEGPLLVPERALRLGLLR